MKEKIVSWYSHIFRLWVYRYLQEILPTAPEIWMLAYEAALGWRNYDVSMTLWRVLTVRRLWRLLQRSGRVTRDIEGNRRPENRQTEAPLAAAVRSHAGRASKRCAAPSPHPPRTWPCHPCTAGVRCVFVWWQPLSAIYLRFLTASMILAAPAQWVPWDNLHVQLLHDSSIYDADVPVTLHWSGVEIHRQNIGMRIIQTQR